ncbi:hypothetical protein Naga_100003g11 [Nannochloropsis gaditana]|uniref:Uncharacterized protein n=1 Tax=Nannochloropsis gaditana TaxID=72520 RepID=W7UB75_9STRA|nr:hypothetical protein Naga_100003g11 [Nannochloropsis gaditana]
MGFNAQPSNTLERHNDHHCPSEARLLLLAMLRVGTLLALGCSLLGTNAFTFPSMSCNVFQRHEKNAMKVSEALYRADVFRFAGSAFVGAALLIGRPEASEAETTLASRKVLYFRYAPRIKSARDFLAKDFKAALDKKDWAAVAAAYEIEKQAPDSSMRNNPQRFINKFEKDLYSPMRIFSQSLSEKGASPKLTALLKAEGELEAALDRLQLVAKGDLKPPKKDGGFLGFGGGAPVEDKYAGLNQEKMAKALFADAKTAFNAWVEVVNKVRGTALSIDKIHMCVFVYLLCIAKYQPVIENSGVSIAARHNLPSSSEAKPLDEK